MNSPSLISRSRSSTATVPSPNRFVTPERDPGHLRESGRCGARPRRVRFRAWACRHGQLPVPQLERLSEDPVDERRVGDGELSCSRSSVATSAATQRRDARREAVRDDLDSRLTLEQRDLACDGEAAASREIGLEHVTWPSSTSARTGPVSRRPRPRRSARAPHRRGDDSRRDRRAEAPPEPVQLVLLDAPEARAPV